MTRPSYRILQITDCHLLAQPEARLLGVDTADTLQAVLTQALANTTPDLLLVTGDITHDGQAATYERFAELVRAQYSGPVLALPGNHDGGAVLANTLGAADCSAVGADVVSQRLPGWRLLALDSHIDDQPEAHVADEQIAQLQELVRNTREPLLLALHHPLQPVGTPWLDKDCLPQGPWLLEWLSQQPQVRAVVFGHVHQAVDACFQRLQLWGTPSTCFQFAPGSQSFTVDRQQPGYRWLTLTEGGNISSQIERLSDYPLTIAQ